MSKFSKIDYACPNGDKQEFVDEEAEWVVAASKGESQGRYWSHADIHF